MVTVLRKQIKDSNFVKFMESFKYIYKVGLALLAVSFSHLRRVVAIRLNTRQIAGIYIIFQHL